MTQDGEVSELAMDREAEPWTQGETYYAKSKEFRKDDDIPESEFPDYDNYLEQTLENPDELWTFDTPSRVNGRKETLYHFIKKCPNPRGQAWYIVIARETNQEDELEIMDAYPTIDTQFLERFRIGHQDIGEEEYEQPKRVVH